MALSTNAARLGIWNRSIDLIGDTLKIILLSPSYTPNKDHQFISDLTGELSGTGYIAGFGSSSRKTLTSKALAKDDTADIAKLSAANLTWTAINAGTARYFGVVKEVTSDADSPVIAIGDINPTAGITTDGNDFVLQWGPNGVLTSRSP